jgi:hypothetical protein
MASAAPGMRRASSSTSYGRSSDFDGMQAQNEHSPPTRRSSTTATASPPSPSRPAATSPAGPAPITTTSKVRIPLLARAFALVATLATATRVP